MDWIKAKYDRLLLGVFGTLALLLGGWITLKALSFKKDNFPRRPDPVIRNDFGKEQPGAALENTKKGLAEVIEIKEPQFEGAPIELFSSVPILKQAITNKTVNPKSPTGDPLRGTVPNQWIYENGLDIRRKDVLELDNDGDGFNNAEEYAGKSNPKDPKSMPPPYTKVKYVETVNDPLTLILSLALGPDEASIKRTEPVELKWGKTIKKDEEFSAVKDGTDKRFKLLEVKPGGGPGGKDAATVEDLLTKQKHELVVGAPLQLPTMRAKLVSSLVKPEEKIVAVGDEFTFEAAPEQRYKVLKIDQGEIELETWVGDAKKETIKLQISSAQ